MPQTLLIKDHQKLYNH